MTKSKTPIHALTGAIQSRCAATADRFPAALILVGLINGIIPGVSFDGWPSAALAAVPVIAIGAVTLGRRRAAKVAAFSLLGLGLIWWNEARATRSRADFVPKDYCGLRATGTVVDPRCVGKNADWLPNPNWIMFQLREFRFSPQDRWRPVSTRVALSLPRGTDPVRHGDTLTVTGYLETPRPPLFPGGFDFKNYLAVKGIRRVLSANQPPVAVPDGDPSSTPSWTAAWSERLLSIRDQLLLGLTSGVDNPKRKGMLAALVFGCRQGLDWRDRRAFLMSGVIHLFAISGLHVGMLALTLFWVLRGLPFRTRHFVAPILLLLYVMTIGFQPSAVRALLMISIWSAARGFLLTTRPLNTVILSASLILMVNPLSLFDVGFQYSFAAAGFLVLAWKTTSGVVVEALERTRWTPRSQLGPRHFLKNRFLTKLIRGLTTVMVAYLATLGVTMFHRGLRVPFSMAVNLLLAPLIWALFLLCLIKIVLYPIPGVNEILAWGAERALDALTTVVGFTASNGLSDHVPRAPLWTLPVFYLALFLALSARGRRMVAAALSILCLTLIFWNVRGAFLPGEVVAFHGGTSQEPVVVILPPREMDAVMINASSAAAVRAAVNYSRSRGVDAVDALLVPRNRKAFCAGCWRLFGGVPVRRMILNENYRKSRYAKRALRLAVESGCEMDLEPVRIDAANSRWSFHDPDFRGLITEDGWIVNVEKAEFEVKVELTDGRDGTRTVTVDFGDGNRTARVLTNRRELTIDQFPH